MFNSRRVNRPSVRVAGLVGLATAGLIASGTMASAATASGPVSSALPLMAAAASGQQTVSETYGCDLSPLGQGLGGLNVNATLSAPASGVLGEMAKVTLTTQATSLSPAVSQLLPALDSVAVAGTAPVNSTSGKGVALAGKSGPVAAKAAELPSVTAAGTLLLTATGTTTVYIPPSIPVTLNFQGKVRAALQCNASEGSVKISVTAPPPPVPVPSGPVYQCSISVNIPGIGQLPGPFSGPMPFAVSATGRRTTGSTDTVWLSPGIAGAFSSSGALGGPAGSSSPGVLGTVFRASLPVTGAQQGSIAISNRTKGLSGELFSGSGHLYLRNPGTDHVLSPSWFTFTIYGPKVPINHKPVQIASTLSCTIKTRPNPVTLTLKVTGKPVPSTTPTSGGGGGTAANGAVPAGAPSTGGGPGPGSDLPMIAGGAALLLIGAGLVIVAWRRRQAQLTP